LFFSGEIGHWLQAAQDLHNYLSGSARKWSKFNMSNMSVYSSGESILVLY